MQRPRHLLVAAALLAWTLAPSAGLCEPTEGEEALPKGLPPGYPSSRVEIDTSQYPWSAIGKVNVGGRQQCTGALVGARVVVTAAHCLWNHLTQRWYPPEYVHFVAGYQRETYPAHSVASVYFVPSDYLFHRKPTLEDFADDWALLELEKPLGRTVGYLGWVLLDPPTFAALEATRATFAVAGYRRDRRHVQSVDHRCRVDGFVRGGDALVAHRCPTIEGDSGGPLVLPTGNGFLLAGIHVGLEREGRNTTTSFVVPTSAFRDQLANFGVPGAKLGGDPSLFGRPGQRRHNGEGSGR